MIGKTNKFVDVEKIYGEDIKPIRTIYKIEEFKVTQTVEKKEVGNSMKDLKNKFGIEPRAVIDAKLDLAIGEVPLITNEEYLKEMVNLAQKPFNKRDYKKLKRIIFPMSNGTEIACAIIKDRYIDKPVMINEVYTNGKFDRMVEYDLLEVLKVYADLYNISMPANKASLNNILS